MVAMIRIFSFLFLSSVQASLRGKINATSGSLSTEALRETVLQEVMAALGSGNRVTQERLSAIEKIVRPTFEAMPKNDQGNLEDAAARYVLHRLFVQRHAMYIKGLEASGMSWNQSSTKEVLEDHVPSFVLSLFEDRLKGQGLGLHELTVLAATLEHLIHDEALSRLGVVYQAHGIPLNNSVNEVDLQMLIDTYMTIFLVGSDMNATSVAEERERVVETYPGWDNTRKFTENVRGDVLAKAGKNAGQNFSFDMATQIVEEIGERYGHWQASECRDLKRLLSKYERPGTGRVLLKDFYGAALSGNWQFSESVDYLQELGALDTTDPKNLAVLIPNYVNSQSNCVASSSIYSVCCINECEALMGHLERQVAAPEASPQQLLQHGDIARIPGMFNVEKLPPSIFLTGLEVWVSEIKRAFEESIDKDDRRIADLQTISSAASFHDGLYTRTVLDAIIESSGHGTWCQVEFVANEETGEMKSGPEEKSVQIITEPRKEKAGEKNLASPVLRKMLTQ